MNALSKSGLMSLHASPMSVHAIIRDYLANIFPILVHANFRFCTWVDRSYSKAARQICASMDNFLFQLNLVLGGVAICKYPF